MGKSIFTERLKELRDSFNLSQKDLAKILSVSQQTIGSWEVGRTEPSNQNLEQISQYFNVSIDYLLGKSDIQNPYNRLNPLTSKKMTSSEKKQLGNILEQAQALFFDDEISEDDKEKFIKDITEMFWEAKEMNRRKKSG